MGPSNFAVYSIAFGTHLPSARFRFLRHVATIIQTYIFMSQMKATG